MKGRHPHSPARHLHRRPAPCPAHSGAHADRRQHITVARPGGLSWPAPSSRPVADERSASGRTRNRRPLISRTPAITRTGPSAPRSPQRDPAVLAFAQPHRAQTFPTLPTQCTRFTTSSNERIGGTAFTPQNQRTTYAEKSSDSATVWTPLGTQDKISFSASCNTILGCPYTGDLHRSQSIRSGSCSTVTCDEGTSAPAC